jgi:GNAT superfamily N-acetyltransferase
MITSHRDPAGLIRRAVPDDAEHLTAIALAAKRHWGYSAEWLTGWAPALTFDAAQVERLDAFVIEEGGVIAGFYATLPGAPRWTLDHLWVRPAHMGRGLGRRLIAHALARARAAGADGLDIEADPHAEPFYARLGARRVGEIAAPAPGAPDRRLPLLALDEIAV